MAGTIQQLSISNGGVPKLPLLFAAVTALGIAGDHQKNRKVHGGPKKALLLLTSEGLEELRAAGFPVYPGALGENITTCGLDRRYMRPGQRYRLGATVEVELTTMRRPCATLLPYGDQIGEAIFDKDVKAGRWSSPRWGLAGFYASVIRTGTLQPDDAIVLLSEAA